MESSTITVIVLGIILVAGLCIIGHVHTKFLQRMSNDMRTIAMFRKSRTIQDIAAMKSLGVHSEDWDRVEKEEDKDEEDDGLMQADELTEEALSHIAGDGK